MRARLKVTTAFVFQEEDEEEDKPGNQEHQPPQEEASEEKLQQAPHAQESAREDQDTLPEQMQQLATEDSRVR